MENGLVADVKKAAKANEFFRSVMFTGPKSQLVVMSLQPGEEIGAEVHDGDQILYVVAGEGIATLAGEDQEIEKGSVVFVPTGIVHNVVNGARKPLKLFTIYAPPQHAVGTVHRTKRDAEYAEAAEAALI